MKLLGDPHLGKKFINDVPLHRRGDREQMVKADFVRQLVPENGWHICMGDLFDSPNADLETILFAANVYRRNALRFASSIFVILRGNHDIGRDLKATTAWHVFESLVEPYENIWVINEATRIEDKAFFGWQPELSIDEQLKTIDLTGVTEVFGHWDTDLRTGERNLVPTKQLAELGIFKAYTGHVHQKAEFERDGVTVVQVGSMQPYAHGEGDMYITVTPSELAEMDVTDKCVRLVLGPGDEAPTPPDCLQFKVIRTTEELIVSDIDLDTFDFNERLTACLAGVPDEIVEAVKTRWSNA